MEWNVDTSERNRSEASLQLDIALGDLLFLRLRETRINDLAKHLLDLLDGELLSQLMPFY